MLSICLHQLRAVHTLHIQILPGPNLFHMKISKHVNIHPESHGSAPSHQTRQNGPGSRLHLRQARSVNPNHKWQTKGSSHSMALVSVRCKLCMIHSPSLACWRRAALIPKAPRSGVDVAASLNSHVMFMLSPQNDAKTIIIIIIIIMHYA